MKKMKCDKCGYTLSPKDAKRVAKYVMHICRSCLDKANACPRPLWLREAFEQLTNPDITEIRLYLPTKENRNEMEQ
jgi:hypothetical protein